MSCRSRPGSYILLKNDPYPKHSLSHKTTSDNLLKIRLPYQGSLIFCALLAKSVDFYYI
jgi:hypothetical protein